MKSKLGGATMAPPDNIFNINDYLTFIKKKDIIIIM
jgi:hypothetical protein